MIAAIYARKSTEQNGVDEEARSVPLQIENAKAFILSKGWTVGPIFKDDGISGAEFERRPDFVKLMDSLRPSPSFQVLVMREESRLGRSTDMVPYVLGKLAKAGVEVWCYRENRKIALTTPIEKFMVSATSFAADMERWLAQQRAYESGAKKAALGHVTGGRVFGYDNVDVDKHVERRPNETEAAVISRMFDIRATGAGYARIAKILNAEGAAAPKPFKGRPALGWSPSSVREALHRELYRGIITWNRTKKRDDSGAKRQSVRPEREWQRIHRPELRIVSEAQWEAAHAQNRRARLTMNTAIGRRPVVRRDYDSKYLLTGFVRCTSCGGSITVVSRSHGRKRAYFYGCLTNWKRGAAVCPNDLVLPIDRVNDAILKAMAGDVLRPAVVSAVIDGFLEQLLPANVDTRVDELRRELRVLDTKIENLTTAIEHGGANLPSVIALLSERQKERDALLGEIGSAETLHQIHVDRAAIEAKVQTKVSKWRELLNGSVIDGRQMLREVLAAPFKFTRDGKTYRFSAPVVTGQLIAGAVLPTKVASPTGFEPVFWP